MRIGILALQGDVREHQGALAALSVADRLIRGPEDLVGWGAGSAGAVDGIILPGGESTTLSMLLESSGLFEPLRQALADGLPAFGTCAGLVLLASAVRDGRADQRTFGVLDVTVRRNGFGRQLDSFETALEVAWGEGASAGSAATGASRAWGEGAVERGALPAVFIRAPVVESAGPGVEVLARLALLAAGDGVGSPVACRQGNVLATTFHPELTGDRRMHRLFVSMVERFAAGDGAERDGRRGTAGAQGAAEGVL